VFTIHGTRRWRGGDGSGSRDPRRVGRAWLAVAKTLKERIAAAGDAGCADLSLAFTRVSRSIRQTLAFKAKLAEMKAKAAEKRNAKERNHAIETSRLRVKKHQVARDVALMVEATSEPESLLTDLHERLMDPDIEDELLPIRVGDVIIVLCDELGIPVELSVWQDKGWFINEGREAPEPPRPTPKLEPQPFRGQGMPLYEWNRLRYHTPPDG